MTAMEGGRWHVESAVPRGPQSVEDDPITLDVQFRVESGSPEAEKLDHWNTWGAPLDNVPAVVRHSGGPFSDQGGNEGLISFVHVPDTVGIPGRMPDIVLCDAAGAHRVRFSIEERTEGRVGGGRSASSLFPEVDSCALSRGSAPRWHPMGGPSDSTTLPGSIPECGPNSQR